MLTLVFLLLTVCTALTSSAGESVTDLEICVPLTKSGELDVSELVERLAEGTGASVNRPDSIWLPAVGVAGGLTTQWLKETLGPEVTIKHKPGAWVFRLDPAIQKPDRRDQWSDRLGNLATKAERQARRRSQYGFHARDSYRANDPDRPSVVLVHGLNSTSGVFRHMVPLLEEAGFGVLLYDYPDNQDLTRSGEEFEDEWQAFRKRTGDRRPWAIVTHSMGGLVARWYVEGDSYQGDVTDLVMIAPPNKGAAIAKMQTLSQFLQGLKAIDSEHSAALGAIEDGLGESADDLLPGSAFLRTLNAKGRRPGVKYHILAGDEGFLTQAQRARIDDRIRLMAEAGGLFGRVTRMALGDLQSPLDELTDGSGDGCVSLESSRLKGVDDYQVVHANHIALVRGPLLFPDAGPVVCLPFVIDRLKRLLPARP